MTGIPVMGIRPQPDGPLMINPLVPETWDYFCLENVPYHGKRITLLYDKTGRTFQHGVGFRVLVNGRAHHGSRTIERVTLS